ncbi:glycosyltransferase [Chitinophaga sp. SYP-B3965]|uniref:glycosyltransferase family 2 protein n=1 Tax=Chitinophaga sp. SYP-B3965 TaxID=2663120 RepID=UPI001299A24D|nr:glycosyltransferase family 2 protein [Chitinophaga sp. SYP-B3965]MRG46921.1 glycosyltransferase [Chitinophaga sp. SYP-B3965]
MQSPLITIITVVYNGAATLEETIKSVVDQTYPNIQYIIIDGQSRDNTVDIIKQYQSGISYWVSEADKGIYDAMNKALDKITGDYVYFIGADDVFMNNNVLEEVSRAITAAYEKDTIFYGNVLFKKTNRVYDGEFNDWKFCLRNISHQAIFYPAAIFKQFKYDLKYKYLADYVLNLELKANKQYRFQYIPVTVCLYNDEGSSAISPDKAYLQDRMSFLKRSFPWYVVLYARLRTFIKKIISK